MGNTQHYTEGHPYSALVHHNADEFYFQLLCMHMLIIHQMGMLLPMYAKVAFSDAALPGDKCVETIGSHC